MLSPTNVAEPPHRVIFDDLNSASGQRLKHLPVPTLISQVLAFTLPQAQIHFSCQTKHFFVVPRAALVICRGFCSLFERPKSFYYVRRSPGLRNRNGVFFYLRLYPVTCYGPLITKKRRNWIRINFHLKVILSSGDTNSVHPNVTSIQLSIQECLRLKSFLTATLMKICSDLQI